MANRIDRDAVIEMWANPARIPTRKIAAHFKIANGTVCWIIIRARDGGDSRAARRGKNDNIR